MGRVTAGTGVNQHTQASIALGISRSASLKLEKGFENGRYGGLYVCSGVCITVYAAC